MGKIKTMHKETEPTFYNLPIEQVNRFDDKLFLLLREQLEDKEKDFLINEDFENNFLFTEAREKLLYLVKKINETKINE